MADMHRSGRRFQNGSASRPRHIVHSNGCRPQGHAGRPAPASHKLHAWCEEGHASVQGLHAFLTREYVRSHVRDTFIQGVSRCPIQHMRADGLVVYW